MTFYIIYLSFSDVLVSHASTPVRCCNTFIPISSALLMVFKVRFYSFYFIFMISMYFILLQSRFMRRREQNRKIRDSYILFAFALGLYAFSIMLVDERFVDASFATILAPSLFVFSCIFTVGSIVLYLKNHNNQKSFDI